MKFAVGFCCLACFVNIIFCTCINGLNPGYGSFGYSPFGSKAVPSPAIIPQASHSASNVGGFPVTSTSPIAPTGLSVLSENLAIDGGVAVGGQLPFLGTVSMDGVLPTTGTGVVTYGCGDGAFGVLSESLAPKTTKVTKPTMAKSVITKPAIASKPQGLGCRGYKSYGW